MRCVPRREACLLCTMTGRAAPSGVTSNHCDFTRKHGHSLGVGVNGRVHKPHFHRVLFRQDQRPTRS